jgi:putative BNR repeat neuraminidase
MVIMKPRPLHVLILAAFSALGLSCQPLPSTITFNDDGGWCWFEDARAIVYKGRLIIGSVAAGACDAARRGNIEVVTYDLTTGRKHLAVLHQNLSEGPGNYYDDHDSPALLVRPDGRILAVYSKHDLENRFYYRISVDPDDTDRWQPERTFIPSLNSRITYSNLHWLSLENGDRGRIYDFFRGLNDTWKPSYVWSDDLGETWNIGKVIIDVAAKDRRRPYVKYVSNGRDTLHMFYTDAHPHDFNNSNYHIYYRGGMLHRSDGTPICTLADGLKDPSEGTRIFQGNPKNVAWVSDIQLDHEDRPYVAYSVRKVSAGAPPERVGKDHRYRYARWNGNQWIDHQIAYGGSRLYAAEEDYTGNIALDPGDPDTVYISTNVDPKTGKPLHSRADGKRHYEIFKGTTANGGASWSWMPITADSSLDNLRPIVPQWSGDRVALLWLRGTYRAYTEYVLAVVGIIAKRR